MAQSYNKPAATLISGPYPRRPRSGPAGALSALENWVHRRVVRSQSRKLGGDSAQGWVGEYPCRGQCFERTLEAWEEAVGEEIPRHAVVAANALLMDRSLADLSTQAECMVAAEIAALALAQRGIPVHLVYPEAPTDMRRLEQLAKVLHLRLGVVADGQDEDDRRSAYACHVTAVSLRHLMFDYLSDQRLPAVRGNALTTRLRRLVPRSEKPLLRGLP